MLEKEKPRPTGQGGNGADTQSVRSDAYHHEGIRTIRNGQKKPPQAGAPPYDDDLVRRWLARSLAAIVPVLEALRHLPGLPADIAAGIPGAAATLDQAAAWLAKGA
jgi:hypothetical protein